MPENIKRFNAMSSVDIIVHCLARYQYLQPAVMQTGVVRPPCCLHESKDGRIIQEGRRDAGCLRPSGQSHVKQRAILLFRDC